MEIVRSQFIELKRRLEEPRRCIQVLAGPRQVGKTTMIKQLVNVIQLPILFVSADDVEQDSRDWIANQWRIVRLKMSAQHLEEYVLVMDEIQKIANWSEQVKREWDSDTWNNVNIKVVLLGSSRLLLKDGLTESLAGRFELIRVPHWTFQEMREAFDFSLEQYIFYGGYPGAAGYISQFARWKKYILQSIVNPAIDKDVLMTKRVLKPALLRQLFEIGCAYSGELLAHTKVLGQLQDAGNSSTLANYLQILDEANLLVGLQKYANDTARKYQSIPKYMVYNNALFSVYQGRSFDSELLDARRWGRWVESAVGAHLVNFAEDMGYKVYYWRERQDEVDFVLSYMDKVVAIEVKSGRRQDNRGRYIFEERFHPTYSLVVGADGLSVSDFLLMPIESLLIG